MADARAHATKVQAPRLEQLGDLLALYNEVPYTHSQRVRKRFRAEKKVGQALVKADKTLKEKYGLSSELALERADDASAAAEARDEWESCGVVSSVRAGVALIVAASAAWAPYSPCAGRSRSPGPRCF